MISRKQLYLTLFLLSASILCFEIISTRITSVIFVNNYAFIILSLAILGLGSGGIFSYYRLRAADQMAALKAISRSLTLLGGSLISFSVLVTALSITNPFIYFSLLFIPFFAAGIAYAQIYKSYAEYGFKLYAADLAGGALGSLLPLGALSVVGAPNSILFLAIFILGLSIHRGADRMERRKTVIGYAVLSLAFVLLVYNGKGEFLGQVPIGNYPEKDFYHVYPDPAIRSRIIDSRWSIYGRSDLVQYSHQDMVRQLFIDGAAGTQLYRFNGNIQRTNSVLQELLLHHTNAIPFLCLDKNEKRTMLIIGPGGGSEVLMGLFGDVGTITGVEVNPDFVEIVKDHKEFDGGIYTDFPSVKILVEEGRHYVKRTENTFDLIVMALPSTEQMQNIEPLAASENYLLTKEAIQDYLKILTPDGRLIFTLHNRWELVRLVATAFSVFYDMGISGNELQNRFAVFEAEYAPTVVIKKSAFTVDEAARWQKICERLPRNLPAATFLPFRTTGDDQSVINRFLVGASESYESLQTYIGRLHYDIAPCGDDRPYFYKTAAGAPVDYLWLLAGAAGFNGLAVWLPLRLMKKRTKRISALKVALPLAAFICIGMGFMIVEVSLFQKLILYLGSPTVSLSILLSSVLIGMGLGSFFGGRILKDNIGGRLGAISAAIVFAGTILFLLYPPLLSRLLVYGQAFRSAACFVMMIPFGFLLGIPFPSCIQLLNQEDMKRMIPWMYGVNGAMSVLGSILAVILSMLFGFTAAFFAGLVPYGVLFVLSRLVQKTEIAL